MCVNMCSNRIAIMSNICDRTDTCTCTYYFTVKNMRLCIVCVVVLIDACIFILQTFYIILHTEHPSVTIICI